MVRKSTIIVIGGVIVLVSVIILLLIIPTTNKEQIPIKCPSNCKDAILMHIKDLKNTSCISPAVFDNLGEDWMMEIADKVTIEFEKSVWQCNQSQYYEKNRWCDCNIKQN